MQEDMTKAVSATQILSVQLNDISSLFQLPWCQKTSFRKMYHIATAKTEYVMKGKQ